MTLLDRISLTWRYGKAIFLIGAVYNLMCARVQAGGFSYVFLMDSFIIKAVITAVTIYLVKQFRDRDAVFFYINLGLSPRRLLICSVLVDYLAHALLMAATYIIYG